MNEICYLLAVFHLQWRKTRVSGREGRDEFNKFETFPIGKHIIVINFTKPATSTMILSFFWLSSYCAAFSFTLASLWNECRNFLLLLPLLSICFPCLWAQNEHNKYPTFAQPPVRPPPVRACVSYNFFKGRRRKNRNEESEPNIYGLFTLNWILLMFDGNSPFFSFFLFHFYISSKLLFNGSCSDWLLTSCLDFFIL